MRNIILSLLAILALAGISSEIAADTPLTDKQKEQELAQATEIPIIGLDLREAVRKRHVGECGPRTIALRNATEDLNFARQMRRKGLPGAPSEADINRAQRALDRETRKRCTMSSTETSLANILREAPPLTGRVEVKDPIIKDRKYNEEQHRKLVTELTNNVTQQAAGRVPTDADITRLREIAEAMKEAMKHVKRQRDAAMLGIGSGDPGELNKLYKSLRDKYWQAQRILELSRARKHVADEAKKKKDEDASYQPDGATEQVAQSDLPIYFRDEEPVEPFNVSEFLPDLAPEEPLTRTQQTWLDAHNQARAYWGVPDLEWDPNLATAAQGWADEMARRNFTRAQHSPREGRELQRENLLTTLPGQRSAYQMVRVWVQERRYFIPGEFPNNSSTGNWYVVAHFTQVIWPYTTHVGCGMAVTTRVEFFVCRYSPPGNRDGVYIEPHNDRWERG